MPKLWKLKPADIPLQKKLSQELGISPILAQVLINRNIRSQESAREFLNPRLSGLHDTKLLPDIDKAKERILKAFKNKENILLFSDYDADGLTSLAVLKIAFGKLGIPHEYYVPHRLKEGYGLSEHLVTYAHEHGFTLIITLDCGISNSKEIEALKRLAIDTIVIDHHQLDAGKLPPAHSVINPKRQDSRYPYQELAGVGLSYKVAVSLLDSLMEEELDLVCIGTIADVVPLVGENRIIVKEGLKKLVSTKRQGLQSLIEVTGLKNKAITAEHVSFILAPRINACGRIGPSDAALELLLCDSDDKAGLLARELHDKNKERQRIESRILQEALQQLEAEIDLANERVIIVHNDNWHQGVLGIIASKISDRFHRPAFVVSFSDGLGKGSGRSIENFHLFEGLRECSQHLVGFGGHKRACGMSILKKEIENFRKSINRIAFEKLTPHDLMPSITIDAQMSLSSLSLDLLQELSLLEPFGNANPKPIFSSANLSVKSKPALMGKDTLKFWVTDGKQAYQAIGFGMGRYFDLVSCSETINLAYRISLDTWNGNNQLQLEIEDIQQCQCQA
ncbi:MAG: single-stranded-DNA-specific exonuclease RecJ [Omnitrophica WOR_2 bacterium GWF2_43_52]|nr:MAG: single-stranded-DNA-specific exonuclease RecJ [Omnitrophica WOR_2 bacterium GWA2_44_7]OGX16606.1 MAG: single-stranded-DNA-specific exonuclease RecJ [Omnitrophica WOR_2 bacterium GWC2_44_8]OGX21322.1 MAG: single-stranded-DNA-specific exonuclease RecJ [Omnitrophica WOR_2 bacterium GWF2_43_52]HAH22060.1 single-stranded-DNA-specific exonuclease RecJ [Candidatus Omnitrophota bacterium]HBG62737.1 single-stranded-DNA-specific exonuclease RecJ [Candidatus Omnitrophota bacterium]